MLLLLFADYFSKLTFSKNSFRTEHYQSVKRFGFRSGPTFCWSLSGSKLFAIVISRCLISPHASKNVNTGSNMCSKVVIYLDVI